LTHEAAQPTLNRTLEASPAEASHALSLVEAAALRAFHRATTQRSPITPCFSLTQALVVLLVRRGFLALCTDDDLNGSEPFWRALYDPLRWRYLGSWEPALQVDDELRQRVRDLAARDDAIDTKLLLWRLLANAEIEGYLAHLLRRHGFSPQWAIDASDSTIYWENGLSLAQMRYVVWASVREGAAAFLRWGGDLEGARDAIATELRRRAHWIEGRPDLGQTFLPPSNARQPTLLTVFLEDIASLEQRYWLVNPSLTALRDLASTRRKRR
jgi:hypothetical protein